MLRLLTPKGPTPDPAGGGAQRIADQEPSLSGPLAQIVTLSRDGNPEAQRTLLVTVGPAMLRVIRGVLGAAHPDVEDTLQDSMVALYLALPGFRGECTPLHFACRIAVQTAMNARRRAGYRTRHTPSSAPEELADLARDDRSPAEIVSAARRREGLRQLVSELPEAQAEVLALHAVLGYTIEETAAVTAAPLNTVRSRLRNALSKLRVRLHSDAALRETVKDEA
ncbi:MAG TPA: sigma-70 family RNA polymerase sigma factor [Polyangiaceae bacterium]|nr:sigma-70 family RNA polymerase sigma factor [Polyangiaceae bacterium]